MKRTFFVCLFVSLLATFLLQAQYTEIYHQPFDVNAGGYTSTYDPGFPADYEVADNFRGLTEPITKFTFYGLTAQPVWTPGPPAATEPFWIKFYEYESEWSQPNPGVIASTTGTYTVNLYDDYGDGWNGGLLNVYVNGTQVLSGLTISVGGGPESHTFYAETGDLITTVYVRGDWPNENWYEILDPSLTVIATDGTGGTIPTGIGLLNDTPISAPSTGTYTVNLWDAYGDGWNGASLDVFVNYLPVLSGITMATGFGPGAFTFDASTGDLITTIFHSGSYDSECSYEILDPTGTVIATDGPVPTGIGFVPTEIALEPDWANPTASFYVSAVSAFQAVYDWGNWTAYRFEVELPTPVTMAEGWISAQIDVAGGATQWFLWVTASPSVDNVSWQRGAAKGSSSLSFVRPPNRAKVGYDMAFTLYTGEDNSLIVIDGDGNSSNPAASVNTGGTIPSELFGADTGVPAVVYTVTSSGVRDVIVYKPAQFTSDWYCWLQVGGNLLPAGNPIPAAEVYWTFTGVDFDAKGDVVIVINDNSTLPVELSSFTAVLTTDLYVEIAWVAESETNHAGYNVLRGQNNVLADAQVVNSALIDQGSSLGSQISYSYIDSEAWVNMQYYYWLESVALDGAVSYFGPLLVTIGNPELDPVAPVTPRLTSLYNAFPNPFNPSTTISYYMAEPGTAKIEIFNLRGQLMKSFRKTHESSGTFYSSWDGRDPSGNPASSGVYLYRMSSGRYSSTKKMVLKK